MRLLSQSVALLAVAAATAPALSHPVARRSSEVSNRELSPLYEKDFPNTLVRRVLDDLCVSLHCCSPQKILTILTGLNAMATMKSGVTPQPLSEYTLLLHEMWVAQISQFCASSAPPRSWPQSKPGPGSGYFVYESCYFWCGA
jgi:hypothetical protein